MARRNRSKVNLREDVAIPKPNCVGGLAIRKKKQRLLIDICTQRDFLEPGAILQVANLKSLVPNLRAVFEWAQEKGLQVVSSVESHRLSEPLSGFPLHCIDGTVGQKKISFTRLEPRIVVETDNYLSLPPELETRYRQVIFRKRTRDVLGNPKADRFLTQHEADEFIIFGVGMERAIKALALGLQARHKNVTIISDACGYWSAGDAELSLRQLEAKGIKLVTTQEIIAPEPVQPRPTLRRKNRRKSAAAETDQTNEGQAVNAPSSHG